MDHRRGLPASGDTLLGKYCLGRLLGRGTFAKVYHGRSIPDGADVAVKVIDKAHLAAASPSMAPRVLREVAAMRRLRHPHVVHLLEVMATRSKIFLVMEYAPGGDLGAKISRRGPLSETAARRRFQQLLSALRFAHSLGVAHRDVKPQNLLLDAAGDLKLSDFGLSALPDHVLPDGLLHTACGTPAYTAPEVVRRRGYDGPRADAWSCGVILFGLLAGYPPFNYANLVVMYRKINRREYDFPAWISPAARRVISRLLDPNPESRITIEEVMKLSWFKKSYQPVPDWGIGDSILIPKEGKPDLNVMNAFDIISLSWGLDLSGLFEGGRRAEKRFTSAAPAEEVTGKVEKIGLELGYRVEERKTGRVVLGKARLAVVVELQEVAPSLLLAEVKVAGAAAPEFEEVHWGELRAGLEDVVLGWHKDGILGD